MLLWGVVVLTGGCGCSGERVVLDHTLVAAGRPGFLRLRGESGWVPVVGRPLAGAEVGVWVEGQTPRSARSDLRGEKTVGIGALAEGVHEMRIVVGSARCESRAYSRLVGTPVIVCDIDGTIHVGGTAGGELAGIADPGGAAPGSAVALGELAREFVIVYLTAREEVFRGKTERFLRAGGFPPGPLVMWDATKDPVSRTALKKRRLRRLKGDWPEVAWGIGDRWSDVEAYRAVGCGVVLIDPGQSGEVVTRVQGQEYVVRGWKEIAALIRKARAEAGRGRQMGSGR